VAELQKSEMRSSLSVKCRELFNTEGGPEIAKRLVAIAQDSSVGKEGVLGKAFRIAVTQALHLATRIYRVLRPQQIATGVSTDAPIFSDSTEADYLRNSIKGNLRFEQLIVGASESYLERRREIAARVYK
jgi:hypothetical protein